VEHSHNLNSCFHFYYTVPGFLYLTFITTESFVETPPFASCELTAAGGAISVLYSKYDIAMAS
jgi:hypothetical protein